MAHDDWCGKTRTDDGVPWRGFTFFRLGTSTQEAGESGATWPAEAAQAETVVSESDGSYEYAAPETGG